jgi:hypothetical protein
MQQASQRYQMTITAVHGGNEMTGVQVLVGNGKETWISHLFSPGEFFERMLSTHTFTPNELDTVFRRIHDQGQITEENIVLNDRLMQFLGLRRTPATH